MKNKGLLLIIPLLGILALGIFMVQADNHPEMANATMMMDGQELEKIPSPDQIANFRVMKNENGTLYGVRIQARGDNTPQNQTALNRVLEKIPAPWLAKDYEGIRPMDKALWGYRKMEAKQERKKQPVVTSEVAACVLAAIDAKDEANWKLIDDSHQQLKAALKERSSCQKLALENTVNQRVNLEACVTAFQATHQEIVKNSQELRKAHWETYRNSLKVCRPARPDADEADLLIEDGGNQNLEAILDL